MANIFDEYNLLATLAGLLAGFSLTGVIELLEAVPGRKLGTVAITLFLLSTLMFVYTLFASAMLSVASLTVEIRQLGYLPALDQIANTSLMIFIVGIALFLSGIALVGWLRSRVVGIITTTGVVVTVCAILSTLVWVVMALPPMPN